MNDSKIVQTAAPADAIDLGMGNPDFNLLPVELLRHASERAFAKGMRESLQYGVEQGNAYFRDTLADFLSQSFGDEVLGSSLLVSNGASSGLDLLTSLVTRPGDTVLVEAPTYFLALRIFADHGLRILSVPMDNEGLDITALEKILKTEQPKLLYTIPTFQNPSGRTLSLKRREKLVELAEKHNFLIVADEVYHLLPLNQTSEVSKTSEVLPPKPFALFSDDSENVASINSFSKILAPGLRLGWIQAHTNTLHKLTTSGLFDSGGGLNPFTSAIVHELITASDLAKNIALLKETYAARLQVMDTSLKEMLPQAEYTTPKGGFFYWVRIPNMDTGELRKKAKAFKVDIRQGALFSAANGMEEYMRLCFAFYNEKEIQEGVKRLANCVTHPSP
jgi:2-aminoadipate transaminase